MSDYDIQIEETSGYEHYQMQLELQQWAEEEARRLSDEYNAIMANAWPGDDAVAWQKLADHCEMFGIDPESLNYMDIPQAYAEEVKSSNDIMDDIPF